MRPRSSRSAAGGPETNIQSDRESRMGRQRTAGSRTSAEVCHLARRIRETLLASARSAVTRPKGRCRPPSTCLRSHSGSEPMRSSNAARSIVATCVTLMTEPRALRAHPKRERGHPRHVIGQLPDADRRHNATSSPSPDGRSSPSPWGAADSSSSTSAAQAAARCPTRPRRTCTTPPATPPSATSSSAASASDEPPMALAARP
jgi:hypothetical protein